MIKNNIKYIISGILILLLISFFTGRCSKPKETKYITVKIKTPVIKGLSQIINNPVPYEVIKDSIIYKDSIVYKENLDLIDRFNKIETEKGKLEEYIKSIEINKYDIPYEDNFIKTNALITTRGDVISFQQKYEIKPQEITIQVPTKETKFALYVGGGLYNNLLLNNTVLQANLGLQNKKGDILSISYDTQQNISLGYSFRLINIKK